MKKWDIKSKGEDIIALLLANRGLTFKKDIEEFLHPPDPYSMKPQDVDVETGALKKVIRRIQTAVQKKESVVVYADYDADGITAGAIMWETLYGLGARVMPYIPHRAEEGYGLSTKGIDAVREQFDPMLIITVDHGITAKEKIAYAKKLGIDVIVTDHHVKPKSLPNCIIVHTTKLSGAGVAWFVAKELARPDPVELAAIGTIADMVPLVGANRSIVKFGLEALNKTKRVGLEALMSDAGLTKGLLKTYDVSHMIAPRLNAMGRIEHALDALRLLCTKKEEKARFLAQKLGLTNRERQKLTEETTLHARGQALSDQGLTPVGKLIFIAHESYNQGVIGLVAGKLVEEFYRPAIVVAIGDGFSKASARSISGFNIVETIRKCSDILVDVGGHPMAAGFTVETKNIEKLKKRLEEIADRELDSEKLTRVLKIDAEISLDGITESLWKKIQDFAPFGFGNPEPVFATRGVTIEDARLVGKDGKHLKLRIGNFNAIAFHLGNLYGQLKPDKLVDIAYTINLDTWNGNKRLQLKIKDVVFP